MDVQCEIRPPAYYYELTEPYRDRFGLITQMDEAMDGGDAAHRMGVFYYGMFLLFFEDSETLAQIRARFLEDFGKIKIAKGRYVRHPDSTKWYSNPDNFSRDQTVPLIIALGAFNEREEIRENFRRLIADFSFYPNKLKNWTNEEKQLPTDFRDVAGPSDLGMYIRALDEKSYRPLLYLTDLQLLGNAFLRVAISYYDDHDTSDDINFSLLLFQAQREMPTFLSEAAQWIYSRFRKVSPFTKTPHNRNAVASAWEYYFSPELTRPPLDKVYQCSLATFQH